MIFAAFGTALPFPRLLNRLDQLAVEGNLDIVVQTGTTPQTAKNCTMFDYAPSLEKYIKDADIVISHGGLALPLELIRLQKRFVLIPRLACFHEHANDHQVEICEIFAKKFDVPFLINEAELTVDYLKRLQPICSYSMKPLQQFRNNIDKILKQ